MTIRDRDDLLSQILGDNARSRRIENWTWHYLVNSHNFPRNSTEKYLDRDAMADFIRAERIEHLVRNRFMKRLLRDSEFQWLSNNERQITWAMRYLGIHEIIPSTKEELLIYFHYRKWSIPNPGDLINLYTQIFTIPGLSLQSLIYLVIDINDQDLSTKSAFVSKMRNEWEIRMERDKIFDFFADNNLEKFNILQLKIQKELKDRAKPDLKHPNLNHILTSFDLFYFSDAELKNLVKNCRAAYDLKIRRSKPDAKKQCNLLLSKSTILQLEKLARNHGFSRSEVMEILIKNEHKHEIYLKERAELKKRLLSDNQDKSQILI